MCTISLIQVCLVITTITCTPFYETLCPDLTQRRLLSQGRCNRTHPEYLCLFDANIQSFVEICRKKADFQRPGYKFILRGSLDGIECSEKYFQPFKFWTNVSSECILHKSECNDEGQITVNKGSSTFDKTCRCDNTQGYAFVKTPMNRCLCMPSLEDCTCYLKLCNQKHVLTPDYECIRQSDWTGHFNCPDVKKDIDDALKKTTPCPTLASLEEHSSTLSKTDKVLPVTICVISGFVIIVIGILCRSACLKFCLSWVTKGIYGKLKKGDAIKVSVDEILQEKEENERIPKKIREVHIQCIQEWKIEDEKFIETKASRKIEEKLKDFHCVVVVGRPGNGKSSIIRHIALMLHTNNAYEIIPIVLGPSNILHSHDPRRNQVFIIDDFCGKNVINPQNVDVWSPQIDDILKLIHHEGTTKVKFLFSTGADIYDDNVFKRLKFSSEFVVNLSEFSLTDDEKRNMIQIYISPQMKSKDMHKLRSNEDYFPLLCKIAENKTIDQITKLFSNLNGFIEMDLFAIQKNDSLQFCIITFCALFNNCFKEKALDGIFSSAKEKYAFYEMCMEFNLGLHKESARNRLKEYLENLEDSYISKTEDYYHFIHEKVYQVAAIVCGQCFVNCFIKFDAYSSIGERYRFKSTNPKTTDSFIWVNDVDTEKRYFDRLIIDLEEGITYSTFHNSQLSNELYRSKFCFYCKERKQKVVELLYNLKNLKLSTLDNECDENKQVLDKGALDYEDYIGYKKQFHFSRHKMHKPFLESAWEGYDDIIKLLLEMEMDINETDRFGRSALIVASYHDRQKVAICLLDHVADHSLRDKKGQSALLVASREGHSEIVNALLRQKADTSVLDSDGYTPFLAACSAGYKNVASLLYKSGANISVSDYQGQSSLFLACLSGHIDVVNFLIEENAKINECNKKGLSPLSIACMKGNADIVKLLLSANADITAYDSDGRTPIFIVCQNGHHNLIPILVERGSDVMTKDWHKQTSLCIACENGHTKTVNALMEYKSDLLNVSDEDGRTPLFVSSEKGNVKIVKTLLKNNADINKRDNKKRSPLYAACRNGHLKVVKQLHEKGASLLDCNKWGGSPLYAACREGRTDVVKYLIANINKRDELLKADSNRTTPLLVACEEGYTEIAKLLINKDAGINECNNEGRTPLHAAAYRGNRDIVKELIQYGADKSLQNTNGHTPIDIAKKKGFSEIEKSLCLEIK